MTRTLTLAGLIASGCWIAGCATSKPATMPPECSDAHEAEIEAAFLAEATAACVGHTTKDCLALPGIREKYAAQRKAWVECSDR